MDTLFKYLSSTELYSKAFSDTKILKVLLILGLLKSIFEGFVISSRKYNTMALMPMVCFSYCSMLMLVNVLICRPMIEKVVNLLKMFPDSFHANEFKGGMLERESILNILLNCASLANLIGNSHVHLEEGYTKSVILLYIHLNYSVFYPVVVFAEMGWFQAIIMVSLYSLKCSVDVLFKSVEKVNQLIKTIENDDILTLNNRIPNHPSVYNEYQRIVNTKLVNIYKYHVNILRVTQLYSKSTRIRICGGILQAIGLNYLLFALLSLDNLNLIGKLLALASSLTGYLLGIAGLSIIGQMCEDELTKLYWTLYKMSWYKWDIENKQIYRMLILRARHIDSIRFGLNSTANKSSLLKYLKTTYAFFAFFYQTSLVS